MRVVLDVAGRQRAGRQAVLRRIGRAADIRTLQVGVALHGHVEPASTGLDARLFVHARIVAVRVAVLRTEAGPATGLADREAAARARLMRSAHGRLLSARDVQVTAHIGHDLVRVRRLAYRRIGRRSAQANRAQR